MEEKENKEGDKKEEKVRKNPLEGKNVKVVHPGDIQKTVLLITDGEKVDIQWNNVNKLEIEMMLTKALQFVKSQQ